MTPAEITATRQLMGWTQAQMAEHLGCKARAVRSWESGARHPPGPVIIALGYILKEGLRIRAQQTAEEEAAQAAREERELQIKYRIEKRRRAPPPFGRDGKGRWVPKPAQNLLTLEEWKKERGYE